MSTRIYNSFEVPGLKNASATSVATYFQKLIEDLREISKEIYEKSYVISVINEADKAIIRKRKAEINNTIYKNEKISDSNYKVRDRFSFYEHYSGSITVFFYEEKVYFQHYFDNHIWKAFLEKNASEYKFNDFSFWDNTDPPDDIPEDEFYARGEVWNKILGDAGVPALAGFSISAFTEYCPVPIPSWKRKIELQPSYDTRLETHGKEEAIQEYITNKKNKNKKKNCSNDLFTVSEYYFEAVKAVTREDIDKKKENLKGILPKSYTKKSLKELYGLNHED